MNPTIQTQPTFYWTPVGVYPSADAITPVEVDGATYYPANSLLQGTITQDGTTYFLQPDNAYRPPPSAGPPAIVWNGTTYYGPKSQSLNPPATPPAAGPPAIVWNGTTYYDPESQSLNPPAPVVAPAPKVLIRITKPKD